MTAPKSGKPVKPVKPAKLATWDGPRFGRWLRRWKESEGLDWPTLSARTGLHTSTLHGLARGTQARSRGGDAAKSIDPAISSVVRLAEGLGLELAYVVRQAGIDPHNDRWANFNQHERYALVDALRAQIKIEHTAHLMTDPLLLQLLGELQAAPTTEEPNV